MEPGTLFNWNYLFTWKGLILFVCGGFFIGLEHGGAGGCTSGHAITGLSNLQLPSLIAVSGFFWASVYHLVTFSHNLQIRNMKTIKYILTGILFGIIMTKSEAVSGIEFRRCSVFNPYLCVELLVLP
jgi:uncharacterized membrane protein YedE/YeeE